MANVWVPMTLQVAERNVRWMFTCTGNTSFLLFSRGKQVRSGMTGLDQRDGSVPRGTQGKILCEMFTDVAVDFFSLSVWVGWAQRSHIFILRNSDKVA